MSDKFGEGRDPYLYPGLDIMRNKLNIRQQQRLEQAAYEMTALRAATIELGPLVRGLPHLRTIHRQLYQDIFDWAGQLREVDIYQGDTPFCHFAYLEKEGNALMQDLEEEEDAKEVVRKQKRERAEREKADAEAERQKDWIAQDAAAFVREHPDVDISKLDGNAKFRRFCGSRYGKEPLSELYADWQELVGEEAAAKAVEKSARKAERSTGAGGGGVSAGLTAAQQRELDEWNREFPHLKMTAKDFLER